MKETVDWSKLPEGLLNMIAGRLFSAVELKRFRSICTSWRSTNNDSFTSRPRIHFDPIPLSNTLLHDDVYLCNPGAFLSHAAFFRITLSSSPSKGWLIKSDVDVNSGRFRLLDLLTRRPLRCSAESLDLLEFTVTEIRESYAVLERFNGRVTAPGFQRSVLVKVKEGEDDRYGVLGIGKDGNINYWNGKVMRKLEQMGDQFSDIVVHKGLTCALDAQGFIWLISIDLQISRYGPPVENITNGYCGDIRFVDFCGDLCIVERLLKENPRKRKGDLGFHCSRTVGFKVFKMDEEKSGKWMDVKSLGDNAFVMAPDDTCFSVSAHEFYGCLPNSIYFAENLLPKVFTLDNGNGGSIATMSKYYQSCFQMFVPSFL